MRLFRGEEQRAVSWWVGLGVRGSFYFFIEIVTKVCGYFTGFEIAIRYSIRGRAACQNWFRLPRYSLENMKKFRSQKEEKPPNLMKRKMK